MKSWFTKFRISNSLDSVAQIASCRPGKTIVPRHSPPRFAGLPLGSMILDQQLKRPPANPATLRNHYIETSCAPFRSATHDQAPEIRRRPVWTWLPVPAMALIAFVGVLVVGAKKTSVRDPGAHSPV